MHWEKFLGRPEKRGEAKVCVVRLAGFSDGMLVTSLPPKNAQRDDRSSLVKVPSLSFYDRSSRRNDTEKFLKVITLFCRTQ